MSYRKGKHFWSRWYHKKITNIVNPTIKEYVGFMYLIIAFSAVIAGLWSNPIQINSIALHAQNTAGQYGFSIGLTTITFVVWLFVLTGTFFVTVSSWLIYKLYFRTPIHKYMRKVEAKTKLDKRRKSSHRSSHKKLGGSKK